LTKNDHEEEGTNLDMEKETKDQEEEAIIPDMENKMSNKEEVATNQDMEKDLNNQEEVDPSEEEGAIHLLEESLHSEEAEEAREEAIINQYLLSSYFE